MWNRFVLGRVFKTRRGIGLNLIYIKKKKKRKVVRPVVKGRFTEVPLRGPNGVAIANRLILKERMAELKL